MENCPQIRTRTEELRRQWCGGGLPCNGELFDVDGSPETHDSNHGSADDYSDSKSRVRMVADEFI
ncbi:hypothetical protein SLEP1_g52185 [Rubroshorea leprosula]|uniref:Uncharacterized protein n=1 Tax=Rubroshorea leprosula TaxID=152421 RepID=A0AAV5M6B0_9ROSI|nr:hypothetical protein SLEP1_g52185 [Rubroshorea leprosula]